MIKKILFLLFVIAPIAVGILLVKLNFGGKDPSVSSTQTPGSLTMLPISFDERTIMVDDVLCYYITPAENIATDSSTGIMFASSELLARATEDVPRTEIEAAAAAEGGKIGGYIDIIRQYQIVFDEAYSLDELSEIALRLTNTGLFESATHNVAFEVAEDGYYEPNDSVWRGDWDYDNPSGGNWGMEAINAPQMWNWYVNNRDKMDWVNIGVFDNQFDTGHPDLVFTDTLQNYPSTSANKYAHGTMVSGVIAAGFDNGIGITGVMPRARLFGASHIGQADWNEHHKGVTTMNLWQSCLTWLIQVKNCEVINVSISVDATSSISATQAVQRAQEFIDRQNKMLEETLLALLDKGFDFLIVKAAGNNNHKGGGVNAKYDILSGITTEELRDRIIVVGAAELNRGSIQVWKSSNSGDRVDIIAPGVDVESTNYKSANMITADIVHYKKESGTSLAAPYVSGVAAAMFGVNPNITGVEVKRLLLESAAANGNTYGYESSYTSMSSYHYPLLDAEAAVNAARNWMGDMDEDDAFAVFLKILQNEESFYSVHDDVEVFMDAAWRDHNRNSTVLSQFTVVDMDGDGMPEVIVMIEPEPNSWIEDFYVLHYRERDGEVYGYLFGLRSIGGLQRDGAMYGSGGAMDGAWYRVTAFNDYGCDAETLAESDSSNGIRAGTYAVDFYIGDRVVTEEEYYNYTTANFSDYAMWYDFTLENFRIAYSEAVG